jgi:hypothetical protein
MAAGRCAVTELLRETLATLRAAGLEPWVEQSRHIKVRFIDAHGRAQLIVISRSPGSQFAVKRHRAVVRRLMRPT